MNMKIEEGELKKLLNEAFEAGFYGCKDIQENVVEELVERVRSGQRCIPDTITIHASTPWVMNNQPNRNGDIFVAPPPQLREVDLNIDTVRIEANPNPAMSEAIRQMQMQEDHRFFAMATNDLQGDPNENENPPLQSLHG